MPVQNCQTVKTGEVAGAAVATQLPDVSCVMVKFKAPLDNADKVYLGGAGVTKADGTTDTTTGTPIEPGEETGWHPIDNVNRFYLISAVGDDLFYTALE